MATEEAIVLVGGLGTRLRAVVKDLPKPLAPVAGRPFLAWVLDQLAENGIRRVILAAGYMAECVVERIGNEWRGMKVDYSVESTPLGTGGAVRQACRMLSGEAVHVLNGDTYLRFDMKALVKATEASHAYLGMALAHVADTGRYGSVAVLDQRVVDFGEKSQRGPGYINAGSYYLTPAVIRMLPTDTEFSFEKDVLEPLAKAGRVCAFDQSSGFIDIGVPEDYQLAQKQFGIV